MQQDVGGQLHRIVPAEILEVDERQRPVRAAQAVVEAEVGRDEAPPFLRAGRPQNQGPRPAPAPAPVRLSRDTVRQRRNRQENQRVPARRPERLQQAQTAPRSGARSRRPTGRPRPRAAGLPRPASRRSPWTAARKATAASMSASPTLVDLAIRRSRSAAHSRARGRRRPRAARRSTLLTLHQPQRPDLGGRAGRADRRAATDTA